MTSEKEGFIFGFVDKGEDTYIIDGLVEKVEGSYRFKKAEMHNPDSPGLTFFSQNDYMCKEDGITGGKTKIEAITTNFGKTPNLGKDGLYQTVKSPGMEPNCIGRIHYLAEDEMSNYLGFRINCKVLTQWQTETVKLQMGFYTIINMEDATPIEVTPEFSKELMDAIHNDVTHEIAKLSLVLQTPLQPRPNQQNSGDTQPTGD